MDGWIPSTIGLPPPKRKHALPKPPTEARQHNEEGVNIVPGSIGSVRLDVTGARTGPKELKLRFFAQNDEDSKLLELRPSIKVFPDTSAPRPQLPDAAATGLSQQAKRYLDDHPSTIHVPYSTLLPNIQDIVAEACTPLPLFDPFLSNRLASTWGKLTDSVRQTVLLAFPMGEGGDQLNVSPVLFSGRNKHQNDIFTPCAFPAVDFKRPILQIVASPHHAFNPTKGTQHPIMAVRTLSSTNFIRLKLNPSHRPLDASLPAYAEDITSITRDETNGRRHMDVALSSSKAMCALMVDAEGALYEWGVESLSNRKRVGRFKERRSGPEGEIASTSLDGRTLRQFHRVDFGLTPSSAYLLSSHFLRQVDLRTRNSEMLLYSLAGSTSVFTSLEQRLSGLDAFESPLVCFSTTQAVSWVDVRMPGRAVVKWEHGRAFDRSLQVVSADSGGIATTFLTSRHTNLTTAYTVSTTDSYAPSSLHDPYVVNPPAPTSFLTPFVRAGITLFRHPELPSERDEISLFELSDRGGLSMRKLGRKVEDEAEELERMRGAPRSGREGYEWLPAVRAVADAEHKGGECGETAEIEKREVTLLDLRKQYEEAFKLPKSVDLATKIGILDGMESVLMELDAPLEQMVTPLDLALLLASNASPNHRSDFLSSSVIVPPAPGTLDALSSHLSNLLIGKDSTFHHSVSDRVQTLLGHSLLAPDPLHPPITLANATTAADQLRTDFGVPPTFCGLGNASTDPQAFAHNACDVLAFDLALSSDVYSSDPILIGAPAPPDGVDELLARATQAMSLVRAAPELSYSYFRPVMKKQLGEGELEGSATARLLMSKWVVGDDPAEYKHVDLRRSTVVGAEGGGMEDDADGEESGLDDHRPSQFQPSQSQRRAPIIGASLPAVPPIIASSQRPPTIATTSAPSSRPSNLFEIPPHRRQQQQLGALPSPPIITFRSPSADVNFPQSQPLPSRHGQSSSQPSRSRVASGASSQGASAWDSGDGHDFGGESQEFPGTQVVDGAFGGKLGGKKNKGGGEGGKKPKKRKGGF